MMENSAFKLVRKEHMKDMPISLAEVKSFLCLRHENDDELLRFLITISTDYAQWFMEKSLAQQTWELTIESEITPRKIYLPFGPLVSVSSVVAVKSMDRSEIIEKHRYSVDLEQSCIVLPRVVDVLKVEIVYVSGHVDSKTIPAQIRYGILHHTAVSYKNRNYVDVKHLSFLKEIYFPFRTLKLVL